MHQVIYFVEEFACVCESRVVHLLKNLCVRTLVVYLAEKNSSVVPLFFRIIN